MTITEQEILNAQAMFPLFGVVADSARNADPGFPGACGDAMSQEQLKGMSRVIRKMSMDQHEKLFALARTHQVHCQTHADLLEHSLALPMGFTERRKGMALDLDAMPSDLQVLLCAYCRLVQ